MNRSSTAGCSGGFEPVLGFPVCTHDLERTIALIDSAGREARDRPVFLACANPHSLVVARRDVAFRDALLSADHLLPDGIGIALASRLGGGALRGRVTGSDLFGGLASAHHDAGGKRWFLLGSTPATLDGVTRRLRSESSRIQVVGALSPPYKEQFSEEDERAMVEAANAAGPDVLWVAMTAPKQEKWILRNRARLRVGTVAAVGAALDFYGGVVTRPGPAFQRLGLEWLPRLAREPRRLWRRMLVSAPVFLWAVTAERMRRRADSLH